MTAPGGLIVAVALGAQGVRGPVRLRRPVHGLVKVPGKGGPRHVKIGPQHIEIRVHRVKRSGVAVAVAKPPLELEGDLDALSAAFCADDPTSIDLGALLVDTLRARGARGPVRVALLRPGPPLPAPGPCRLGLVVPVHAPSLGVALAHLAAASTVPRPLRALVVQAIQDIEFPHTSRPEWEAFDVRRYLAANYEQISMADAWLCRALVAAWARIEGVIDETAAAIDVGTGPNLYTILAALPHVHTVTAHEVAADSRRYLREQRRSLDALWRPWIELLGLDGTTTQHHLHERLRVSRIGIYDLAPESADVVTMFFCAESVTANLDVFERGCNHVIVAVRPGGALLCAFMLGSSGYETAGIPLPAVPITAEMVHDVFAPHVRIEQLDYVPGGAEARPGYDGMLFLFGWREPAPSSSPLR